MSTTQFSFKAKVKIGDQIVPLASRVVVGDSEAAQRYLHRKVFRAAYSEYEAGRKKRLGITQIIRESLKLLRAGTPGGAERAEKPGDSECCQRRVAAFR